MSSVFESIKQGLTEAIEHAAGRLSQAVVHPLKSDDRDEYPKVTQADLDRATFRTALNPVPPSNASLIP